MTEQDWLDMASIYRAGAAYGRGSWDAATTQQAGMYEAMAARCEEVAQQRAAEAGKGA